MAGRSLTVHRFEEIKRLISSGRSVREIAQSLKCSRKTVRGVRDGVTRPAGPARATEADDPLWMSQVDWTLVLSELSHGHALKFIWSERAATLTQYPNFWKQFYRKYPQYRAATVTLRDFDPGERVEVDYAGDAVEWVDLKTGEVKQAWIFLGGLGFSQLVFAWAAEDMKSRSWLSSHRRMFEAFGGVPHTTVPDCLKQGVSKCHIYDPDLNPAYCEFALHYGTTIVPARPRHPKDKAIVEGLVGIFMRYFQWRHRGRTFTSVHEINGALAETAKIINEKPHTRFRVSRQARFDAVEKKALKPLPDISFEVLEWRRAKLHPDCFISVEGAYYSAPHIHRGRDLRVKLTENHVEIFLGLDRVALHRRDRHRCGNRVRVVEHLPENSRAYIEATPQNLLSQSRFVSEDLHGLIVELFDRDTLGSLRRVQGLVRACTKEIKLTGREAALPRIASAIKTMRHFSRVRVDYFQQLLGFSRRQTVKACSEREINRQPNNPMLRYNKNIGEADADGIAAADLETAITQTEQETMSL